MIAASFKRSALADAMAWACRVVPPMPASPILSGLRMTFDDAGVTLRAFDYDTSHTAHVEGDVGHAGDVVVSGHLARDMVAALQGSTVKVEQADGASIVTVTADRSTYRLPTMPVGDYPTLPDAPPTVGFAAAADLLRLSKSTWWAVGRDEILPALTAVEICGDDDGLKMSGTNRFVVASARSDWDLKEPFEAKVPGKQLGSALAGMSGRVEIGCTEGLLRIASDTRAVTTRQLGLDFPNVEALFKLADKAMTRTIVDVADLTAALKRAVVALERNHSAWLHINPDHIAITAGEDNAKSIDDVVDAQTAGPPLTIGFNPGFLVECLASLNSETALIEMTAPGKPARVTPHTDHPDMRALVMPRSSKT